MGDREAGSSAGGKGLVAVSPVAPWPIRDGLTLRIASILEALSRRRRVVLVAPEPDEDEAPPPDGIDHRPFALRRRNGGPAVVPALGIDLWPYPLDPEPLTGALERVAAAEGDADVLCWSGAELSTVQAFGREICLDLVDCFSLQAYRDARANGDGLPSLERLKDAALHWVYEWAVVTQPSMVLVAGTEDGTAIRRIRGSAPVRVLANGVDVEAFHPRKATDGDAPVAVFHGSLDYGPNVEALRFLGAEIWTRVLDRVPDARLLVVGRRPTAEVRALERLEGVEVVGPVEDMPEALGRGSVSVAPMVSGTRVRNNILEAWAMGLPVVTTRIGTNGVEWTSQETALVADDPGEFARSLVRLFRDPELRDRLGRAGRDGVVERHTWAAVAERMEGHLAQTAVHPA